MKLQINKRGQTSITVPKAIVDAKGWTDGQELAFKFGPHGELILEEKK